MSKSFKPYVSVGYSEDCYDDEMEHVSRHFDTIVSFIEREARATTEDVISYVGNCAHKYGRSFIEALDAIFGEYRSSAYTEGRVNDVPYIYSATGRLKK